MTYAVVLKRLKDLSSLEDRLMMTYTDFVTLGL